MTPLLALAPPAAAGPGDGDWSPPVVVGRLANPASLAMSADGSAFAVWQDASDGSILASRFVPGAGWLPPVPMPTNESQQAFLPAVAVDDHGGAVVTWNQADGPVPTLWAARFVGGLGWTQADPVEMDANYTGLFTSLAVGPAGDAVALWARYGAGLDLWAARLDPQAGWGAPQFVAPAIGGAYAAAVGPSGEAVALFNVNDGNRLALQESWSTPGVPGWTPPVLVEEGTANVNWVSVAIGSTDGTPVAVWDWFENATAGVAAAQRSPTAGWSEPVDLSEASGGSGQGSLLDVGPDGTAVAMWQGYGGPEGLSVWANRLPVGGNWSAPELIIRSESGYGVTPVEVKLAQDDSAVALVLDRDGNGTTLSTADLDSAGNWSLPEPLKFVPDSLLAEASLAGDGQGNALVLWREDPAGTPTLYSSMRRFVDTTAPSLTVLSPAQGELVNGTSLWVRVATEPGAEVYVNGLRATDEGDGTYAALVPVQEGDNHLQVSATDAAGNTASAFVDFSAGSVVRQLVEALALEEEKTQQALDEAYNASFVATATGAQLDSVRAVLNATNEQLVNVSHELGHALDLHNQTLDELAATSAELNETKATVEQQEGDLQLMQSQAQNSSNEQGRLQTQAESASASAGLANTLAIIGAVIGGGAVAFAAVSRRRTDDDIRQLQDCCEKWKRSHGGGPAGGTTSRAGESDGDGDSSAGGVAAGGAAAGGAAAGGAAAGGVATGSTPGAGGTAEPAPVPGGRSTSGGPQPGEPRGGDPQHGGPHGGDPRQGGPHGGDPRQGGPRGGDPRQGGPQRGGPPQDGRKPEQEDPRKSGQIQHPEGLTSGTPEPSHGAAQGGSRGGPPSRAGPPPRGGPNQGPPQRGAPDPGMPPRGGPPRPDARGGPGGGMPAGRTDAPPGGARAAGEPAPATGGDKAGGALAGAGEGVGGTPPGPGDKPTGARGGVAEGAKKAGSTITDGASGQPPTSGVKSAGEGVAEGAAKAGDSVGGKGKGKKPLG